MKRIYLIDTENISNYDFLVSENVGKNDELIFFCSSNSRGIRFEDAKLLLENEATKSFEVVNVGNKNALDFQLVTYVSINIAAKDAEIEYYIVSNDKGYEVAISYIKEKIGVEITRVSISSPKIDVADDPVTKFLELDSILKQTYPKIKTEVVEKIENIIHLNYGRNSIHNKLVETFGKQGLEYYKVLKNHL